MESRINIVLVQTDTEWESPKKNIVKIEGLLKAVDLDQANMVVLPEMFASGFTMSPENSATPRKGFVVEWMKQLAKKHSVHVIGSHVESRKKDYYNTAVVAGPNGRIIGSYDKIHLFGDERNNYGSGDKISTFDVSGAKASVFICYDLRFPEIFRSAVSEGVEIFIVVANWPSARQRHWEILLKARALENQAYVVAVNRVGRDPAMDYAGGSCVLSPEGEIIYDMSGMERAAMVTLDMRSVTRFRKRYNFLSDMVFPK